jgi:hypothetical protein
MIVVEVDGQKPEELLPEIIAPEPVPLQLDKENQTQTPENQGNIDEFAEDDDWI